MTENFAYTKFLYCGIVSAKSSNTKILKAIDPWKLSPTKYIGYTVSQLNREDMESYNYILHGY